MGTESKGLVGRVAVVAGATRHAGRGIAIELGIAGATVYCTGRSTRQNRSSRVEPGSIEETVKMVEDHGGNAIWAQVDYSDIDQAQALFEQVIDEQGRLDILVTAISGNATNDPFLESDLASNLEAVVQGGSSHVIATHTAAKKMAALGKGLIVCISDHEWDQFYAIEKAIINRLPVCLADELCSKGIAIVSLLPGAFFQFFEVMTMEELTHVVHTNPAALKCHTPRLIGRGVVALATDRDLMDKTGKLLELKDLVQEYSLTDIDGRQAGEMW